MRTHTHLVSSGFLENWVSLTVSFSLIKGILFRANLVLEVSDPFLPLRKGREIYPCYLMLFYPQMKSELYAV